MGLKRHVKFAKYDSDEDIEGTLARETEFGLTFKFEFLLTSCYRVSD